MHASMAPLLRLTILIFCLFLSNFYAENRAYAGPFENYSEFGGEVDRAPNRKKRKSCSDYYYCGPTTTIELSMHSSGETGNPAQDLFGAEGYDMGENGTFEQILQMGEDQEKRGIMVPMMERIQKTADADDGQTIKIVMPMIDYGFSGSFSNILIRASKSGVSLHTEKKDRIGTHQGFTGSVTIEEYSPYVIKGAYSGALFRYQSEASKDYRGPAWEPIPVNLVESGSVTGEFNIINAWKNDDRINDTVDYQSSVVDPMKNDIKQHLKLLGLDMDDEIDREFDKVDIGNNRSQGRSNSSGGSANTDIYDGCNCSCNFTESATPKCKTLCSDAFGVCKGDRYTPPARQSYINDGELQPKLDELASELEELAPKIKDLAPELEELAPKLQELAPALRDLGPEIEEMGENLALKPGEKFMNLDQDVFDRFENNTLKPPANMREQYIVLVDKKIPGPAYASFRDNMIKEFDAAPDDKSRMIMFIAIGGKE